MTPRSLPLPAQEGGGAAPRWWHWQRLRRFVLPAFALLVVALIASNLRDVDWPGAWRALRGYDARTLLLAALLAASSHALYGSFDLLGRAYSGHHLPAGRVWATAFVSYAFNLNLGSIIGGIGLRLRLYARQGLRQAVVARVIGLSLVTNWLGHAALGGIVLVLGAITTPPDWPLHGQTLKLFGGTLIAGVLAYLALCVGSKRSAWTVRGQRIELPRTPIALMQVPISMANWSLMGGVIFMLLHGQIAYPTVLGVLLLAGIAGVITHVPAGLGVLEAVFLTLLAARLPQGPLLGALLAYRVLYYLVPFAAAIVVYFTLEGMAGRQRQNWLRR